MNALDAISPENPHLDRDLARQSLGILEAAKDAGEVNDPIWYGEQHAIMTARANAS